MDTLLNAITTARYLSTKLQIFEINQFSGKPSHIPEGALMNVIMMMMTMMMMMVMMMMMMLMLMIFHLLFYRC